MLELLLRLELDCERTWDGISGTDPSGEKDWCRLCPTAIAELGETSTTEFEKAEPACFDGGGIDIGDTGEDIELRPKRLLRSEEPFSAEAVMIG